MAAITDIYNYFIEETTITFETQTLTAAQMGERINGLAAQFPYFVFECDGKVAGYCYVHLWKERAAYSRTLETTVYVSPQYHRRGIGMALMQKLIDECRQRGYHALIACITDGNDGSVKLHERLGFSKVSHFSQVGQKFGRLLDVIDMELIL